MNRPNLASRNHWSRSAAGAGEADGAAAAARAVAGDGGADVEAAARARMPTMPRETARRAFLCFMFPPRALAARPRRDRARLSAGEAPCQPAPGPPRAAREPRA